MTVSLDPWLSSVLTQADNLPSLPGVALEVLRLCRAEETTLDDLAGALSRDAALAARLLRFANSSLYGSGEEVRTLQRATLVLGMKTVQLMSLSFSLVAVVPRQGTSGHFDYPRFWHRSLVRAVSARALAGRLGLPAQDEAFLAGLVGEIGQVVLARCLPEPYAAVLAASTTAGDGWPRAALERELLGFDHLDVASALLRSWELPRVLQLAVRHGPEPETLPEATPDEIRQLVRVLALAAQATELFTGPRGAVPLERIHSLAGSWFGLGTEQVNELLMGLDAPIRETAQLLELGHEARRSHVEILEEARTELVARSLGQARELENLRGAVDPAYRSRLLAASEHLDALTGCANEAALQRILEHELRARLDGNLTRSLGLVLFELQLPPPEDGAEGRAEGQRALAGVLAGLLRKQDLAARLGEGRFAALLGDATPFGLRALAQRVQRELARLELTLAHGKLRLTAAAGGACLGSVRSLSDGAALREVAERLLTRARQRGPGELELHATVLQPR